VSFGTIFLPNGERTEWGSVCCRVVTLSTEGERSDAYFGSNFEQNMQIARNEAEALMSRLAKQSKECNEVIKNRI
jgi:hypothetical protein